MTSPLDEKELYGPVSDYFIRQGYFVVSDCEKHGIEGTAEFGLRIEDEDQRVDIAAAKWDDRHVLEAIAVECKRLGSRSRSVGAGLWQAVNYQVAFDKVFIATEDEGELRSKASVLDALGIGHIIVNLTSKRANIQIAGDFRRIDRFDESVRARQVAPRLGLFLAFTDALGKPIRYGETFDGGGYIAKDMGNNVQLNAWFDHSTRRAYFGINIERIATFRKILAEMDWGTFQICLKNLGEYRLTLTKDPVPGRRGAPDVVIINPTPCSEINGVRLQKEIKSVVYDQSRPRRWRPHLTIFKLLWEGDKLLSKVIYLERIRTAKEELSDLLRLLATH